MFLAIMVRYELLFRSQIGNNNKEKYRIFGNDCLCVLVEMLVDYESRFWEFRIMVRTN